MLLQAARASARADWHCIQQRTACCQSLSGQILGCAKGRCMFAGIWQAAPYNQGVSVLLTPRSLRLCSACNLWTHAGLSQAAAWSLLLVVATVGCRQCLADATQESAAASACRSSTASGCLLPC